MNDKHHETLLSIFQEQERKKIKAKRKIEAGKDEKYYAAKKVKPEPYKPALERKGSLAKLATKSIAKSINKKSKEKGEHHMKTLISAGIKPHGPPGNYASEHMPKEVAQHIANKTYKISTKKTRREQKKAVRVVNLDRL